MDTKSGEGIRLSPLADAAYRKLQRMRRPTKQLKVSEIGTDVALELIESGLCHYILCMRNGDVVRLE